MVPVRACLLTIGDELLTGDVTDTNSSFMGAQLRRCGVQVVRQTSVRDRLDEIGAALELAQDCDICLVTGGLGPTTDDLTATALARAAGLGLVRDPQVVKQLYQRFEGHLRRHAKRFGEASAAAL